MLSRFNVYARNLRIAQRSFAFASCAGSAPS